MPADKVLITSHHVIAKGPYGLYKCLTHIHSSGHFNLDKRWWSGSFFSLCV